MLEAKKQHTNNIADIINEIVQQYGDTWSRTIWRRGLAPGEKVCCVSCCKMRQFMMTLHYGVRAGGCFFLLLLLHSS
jgi:hypothetical protein